MTDHNAELPNKLYFKIGEVASLVGVKPYVLRYWETEFNCIRPTKTRTKHRMYRRKDVQTLLEIKRLLYDERFTIEGARRYLKGPTRAPKKDSRPSNSGADPAAARAYRTALLQVKKELESLQKLLS